MTDVLTKRKEQIEAQARREVVRMVRNALANGFERRSSTLLSGATVQNNIVDASEFNITVPGARYGGTYKVKVTRYRGAD